MQVEDVKPWYQQFWPWAVMFFPATAVVAGLYTYSLAATNRDGLVVDDYYKVGQAINRSLAHGQRAADMGLIGNLALNGQAVRLLLNNAQVESQQQLVLKLSHATIPGHDQSVNLHKTGVGEWSGKLEVLLAAGKWYVDLLPMDESWRLEGTMPSAQAMALDLKPAL